MAKGKKGPALFEVIRAAQQKQIEQQRRQEQAKHQQPGTLANAASVLMSPSMWLGGRRAQQSSELAPHEASDHAFHREPVVRDLMRPVEEPMQPEPRQPVSVAAQHVEPESLLQPAARVEAPAVVESPVVERPRVVVPEPESPAAEAARRVREEIAAASRIKDTVDDETPDPVYNNFHDVFGRDPAAIEHRDAARQPFNFRLPVQLNYTTGLIAGLALLTLTGAAIIALSPRDSVDPVAQKRPDVLNVSPAGADQNAGDEMVARVSGPTVTTGVDSDLMPVALPDSGKRIVGVQYVVLLSLPQQEEAEARKLVKFLGDNGISVTAEKALPGYSPSWYSIVTTTGFHRCKNNPHFDEYVAGLSELMQTYAKGSRFKTFKPDVYTWRVAR